MSQLPADRRLHSFFREGPTTLSRQVSQAVMDDVRRTRQVGGRGLPRNVLRFAPLVAAAAVIAIMAVALTLNGGARPQPNVGTSAPPIPPSPQPASQGWPASLGYPPEPGLRYGWPGTPSTNILTFILPDGWTAEIDRFLHGDGVTLEFSGGLDTFYVPGRVQEVDPEEVTIAGYPGFLYELPARPDGTRIREWMLNIDGRWVNIDLEISVSALDVDEAMNLLESIRSIGASPATSGLWEGPVRTVAGPMQTVLMTAVSGTEGEGQWFGYPDGEDAAGPFVDITEIEHNGRGQRYWRLLLATAPPKAVDLDPSRTVISYGLTFDRDADGVADHVVGISNDMPTPGEYRVWVTDLETGTTEEQLGPPYGFPVEFAHPDESQDFASLESPMMRFWFLTGSSRGLGPANFYAWASVSLNGEIVAWDYAPDFGWLAVPSE
jgi:hypothetical protein